MSLKYVCKVDETPEIKEIADEVKKFIKTAKERHQFLQAQMDAIGEERSNVWNKLWDHLKATGRIKSDAIRDQNSLSFCDDLEQVFISRVSDGNPFMKMFDL